MYIKRLNECEQIIAGDNCFLRELLNPLKEKIEIRYSLAHAMVKAGEITCKHSLKTTEVYYILEGEGEMYIEDEKEKVCQGDAVYIPPDSVQRIKNTGQKDLVFICVVDPAWKKEDEKVLEEKQRS
ncbi:MAG: cupin domain-containing protein [Spirochaetes bacterium]|nr:cupin domain-containing protein [Spirochaetota bacterium]